MAKRYEIRKCELCGNIVEVVHASTGPISCCGQEMTLLTENTVDAAKEKHVPVKSSEGGNVKVAVGAVAHPMEEIHYIEWIEIIDGNKISRRYLKPGEAPEATFASASSGAVARAYCNLHGHWKS